MRCPIHRQKALKVDPSHNEMTLQQNKNYLN
ncbi:hypothetical protein BN439_2747 [Erwinia amylovora Ea644]|nr:hypothetical protein BN439_2747 [Erwinia amylovora Ea644]CCP07854.1 hypothetical protein BN440_2841 [Erwinia amylovora MR1]